MRLVPPKLRWPAQTTVFHVFQVGEVTATFCPTLLLPLNVCLPVRMTIHVIQLAFHLAEVKPRVVCYLVSRLMTCLPVETKTRVEGEVEVTAYGFAWVAMVAEVTPVQVSKAWA
mmetsp:Transcript_99202/g.248747  ORF Transcript_99202/g.248747 Transcript_99202/m.248747 type:complete len:114 (+) Transcript_99202:689-1030(+)